MAKNPYANSKTPYIDMYKDYEKKQNKINQAYRKQIKADRTAAINASNAEYDNAARQNYINYMQAQKNLPSQLNSLGIRGGASESSLIRLGSNYGTNVANNAAARGTALAGIRQTYADKLASYNQEVGNKLAQAYMTAIENQLKWEQEQKALRASGGGGGGGRSYGGGGYGGYGGGSTSTGSDSNTTNVAANVNAAQQRGAAMTDYYTRMMKNANKNKGRVWGNNWSK